MEVVVPDLGDFSDVEVIELLVAAGDTVEVESPLIVLETDKATMEIPSSHAGTVRELKVATGDRVSAGDVIAVLDVDEEAGDESTAAQEPEKTTEPSGAEDETVASNDSAGGEAAAEPREEPVAVPDLGDFADVEVVEVLVAAGDEVARDDPLIVLETDKATMEVPAPMSGRIVSLDVSKGDRVSGGDPVLTLETTDDGGKAEAPPAARQSAPADAAPGKAEAKAEAPTPAPGRPQAAQPVDERSFGRAHASPSVRKLARELGVDLGGVTGSGRKGRITSDDLKAHVKGIMQGGGRAGPALPEVPVVDFASFGEIEQQPLSRIQKISGPRLQASWVNIPHVTQHDEADITELEELRQSLKARAGEEGVHLTPLAFVMRATVLALDEFPVFRSSLDPDGQSLIVKHFFHIGFAADTPNGLVVPVVRDANELDLFGLARALGELSEKARDGKLKSDDIQGGVFTISSLGGIGGTFFTPIINAPEVAILGVSRSQRRPVYRDDKLEPRLILPLSLSYDHRVIDGATAVRFTTKLGELLAEASTLAEGLE
jgi:pyruvate dehydrogenase E2 component (dihydrolipoamide acetyltransferase)